MVYQEDVSRVAIDLAGFPIEEADLLRKILSKKDRHLKLPDMRERFFRGARARGVSEEIVVKVWDMILSFDGYSFCKAHSASYAQVSYRVAYLKRFYPLEFMASVINNGGGFYGRQTYVDECRRLGFAVLPPDVNKSRVEYTVERLSALDACQAALRVGLGQLKTARQELVRSIVEEREKRGAYAGLQDFFQRTRCGFEDIRALIRSGALDSIADGHTRPQLFFRWNGTDTEVGLGFDPPSPPSRIGDYSTRTKLADEVKTLGIVVSQHPLNLFRPRIQRIAECHHLEPLISSTDIPACVGRKVWIPGILVTGKEVATKRREPMIFVSFEDETSIYETVLFPAAFTRFYPLLDDGWAFLVFGRVQEDLGAFVISVEKLLTVSRRAEERVGVEANVSRDEGGHREQQPFCRPQRPPVFMWGRDFDEGRQW